MGCGCLYSINNIDKNSGYVVNELEENLFNAEKNEMNNEKIKNNTSNYYKNNNQVNLNKRGEKPENSRNSPISDKIFTVTSNFESQKNNENSQLLKSTQNYLNQTSFHDRSDTRSKYTKTIINFVNFHDDYSINFPNDILREINIIRTNPILYVDKIRDFMKYINTDKKNNHKYILINRNTKINLSKGEEAFLNCVDFICDFDKKIKEKNNFLNVLELKKELTLPFPTDDPEKCFNTNYIKENLLILKTKLEENFKLKGFHYDLSTNNPEISTILQIVDDNNSGTKRRNMLLDDSIKYIGVNIGKLKDNLFCIYLVFAA